MALLQETSGSVPTSPIAAQGLIPNSFDWVERINIRSRQDKLDPAILEKLAPPSTMAAVSVHRYWTSVWMGTVERTDLSKLIKMVKMNTVWSYVLNYKLYKVFVMRVDELRSKMVGAEDIDVLCSENKALYTRLAISEEARA
ncbi:hypothetical protein Adt_03220 [Abeliophyllum distichum]|uniref:Uncharacterized protein n=1 Tax=Abeliophyllum distichum TaxID=126358 RepID=A0ABD1VY43_9LAMI